MHTSTQLLSACVTMLIVATSALPTSMKFDSEIIPTGLEPSPVSKLAYDNVETNNYLSRNCQYSDNGNNGINHLQINCNIRGLPLNETNVQTCNLKLSALDDSKDIDIAGVYRFKQNKLMVHVTNKVKVSPPNREDHFTIFSNRYVPSFYIYDNCVLVKTIPSVGVGNGRYLSVTKLVIYEDGFDLALQGGQRKNSTFYYQSYDSDGQQIGDYIVPSEQLSSNTYRYPMAMNLDNPSPVQYLQYAKKHSRGVAITSGYHFYPNGTIVRFADEEYSNSMKSENFANDVDDGPFFTACVGLPDDSPNKANETEDIDCWQYDVDQARLVLKAQVPMRRQSMIASIKNLEKGGFLIAIFDLFAMTVRVIRPDRPATIDNIDFGSSGAVLLVSDFNEATGKITVLRDNGLDTRNVETITRSHHLLQNYATSLTENV